MMVTYCDSNNDSGWRRVPDYGGVRRLSCMTSGRRFDVLKSVLTSRHRVLTSFSAKRYDVDVDGRSWNEHFLTKNVDILA